ncbi:MAG: DNA recombination protein RmuC [Acidimicrobiia bacterium]|nr:DNA recombination protein RmuC [Acidimicrobiia bacterium]
MSALLVAAAAGLSGLILGYVIARLVASSERAAAARNQQHLRDTFQSLAAEALHANRAAFLDLAQASFAGLRKEATADLDSRKQAIDTLVQPLLGMLKEVDARVAVAERERVAAYAKLAEQVSALGSSAHTLSRALRTPAVRGRWGEMQLRRVAELAGMLEHCDFDEQQTLSTEDGRRRPDMVVHLPEGRSIVVDAKAPLDAYLDAQECADEEERRRKLAAHARQVRDHVEKLAGKAYWEQMDDSPEMVVLFLPGEALFAAALQHDLTLVEQALERRVLLASPITLIALLATVAHSWRQDALATNYREVAMLGREFYERLATFTEYFDDLRKKLDGAVQAYNTAVGSFESRVLVSARRLRDLDVTTADEVQPAGRIDTVPRVLRQANLIGVPEEATTPEPSTVDGAERDVDRSPDRDSRRRQL